MDSSQPPPELDRPRQLAEVWGDVVDVAQLRWSSIIGISLGLSAFLVSRLFFRNVASSPELAKTYALLVGLLGCLIAGTVCTRLFPPKRDLVEELTDPAARDEALAELAAETGDLGNIDDLPEAARRELRSLGIYDLFTDRDDVGTEGTKPAQRGARTKPTPPSDSTGGSAPS